MTDLQTKLLLRDAITRFSTQPLRAASLGLFASLGYQSDRTIAIDSVEDFCTQFDPSGLLAHPRVQKSNWKAIELLFQLTDEELSRNATLFKDTAIRASLLQSYVFFAVELQPGDYARGKLAAITRQINRVFPMPVMVLFKVAGNLSIAVINRRQNKRDESKDVLGKVTLIQNISTVKPHPGHLDILASFSTTELLARKKPIGNFDQLHAAWEDVFNVELLNKRFYEELSNWYFWARKQVSFPADLEPDVDTRNATSVIRLLTRLIFCWFLKEKDLIPDHLFDQDAVASALNSVGEEESTYYHAILQNLFFATLNQPMNADGEPVRQFAADGDFQENRNQHGVKTLYRYKKSFRDPTNALALFEDIPFLNGGLFACLDTEDDTGKVQYADGFSRNPKKQPVVPNRLFFAAPHDR
jgi:adenine-specific DNA-methyltransferase